MTVVQVVLHQLLVLLLLLLTLAAAPSPPSRGHLASAPSNTPRTGAPLFSFAANGAAGTLRSSNTPPPPPLHHRHRARSTPSQPTSQPTTSQPTSQSSQTSPPNFWRSGALSLGNGSDPNSPGSLAFQASAVAPLAVGEAVVVHGGVAGIDLIPGTRLGLESVYSGRLWLFIVASLQWVLPTIASPAPSPRAFHTAQVLLGPPSPASPGEPTPFLFIFGGLGSNGSLIPNQEHTYLLNLHTYVWSLIPAPPSANTPAARWGVASAVWEVTKTSVFIFGGACSDDVGPANVDACPSILYRFDARLGGPSPSGAWSVVPLASTSLAPLPRFFHVMAYLGGRIVVAGGWDPLQLNRTAFNDTWIGILAPGQSASHTSSPPPPPMVVAWAAGPLGMARAGAQSVIAVVRNRPAVLAISGILYSFMETMAVQSYPAPAASIFVLDVDTILAASPDKSGNDGDPDHSGWFTILFSAVQSTKFGSFEFPSTSRNG